MRESMSVEEIVPALTAGHMQVEGQPNKELAVLETKGDSESQEWWYGAVGQSWECV